MTQQSSLSQSFPESTSRIGGSILPSSDSSILQPMAGAHGTLQVRPLPEDNTYGLFFGESQVLAKHPNGYSCHALAKRILAAWRGEQSIAEAMEQFDYILDCGGEGQQRVLIEHIVRGMPPTDHCQ